MSNSILDLVMSQLGGGAMKQLGQQAGVDEKQAESGLKASIPLLLGAMERNAADDQGANAIKGALERDHDGSILDNIQGFLGDPKKANGAGILKHVLGGKREAVEGKMAKQAGIDKGAMGKLMEMAAPLLLGALGKQQRSEGLDIGQLAGFLGGQREQSEKSAGMLGLVEGFLDADKDGSVLDDLADMAGNFFGKK